MDFFKAINMVTSDMSPSKLRAMDLPLNSEHFPPKIQFVNPDDMPFMIVFVSPVEYEMLEDHCQEYSEV